MKHFSTFQKNREIKLGLFVFIPYLIWIPLVAFSVPFQYILAVVLVSYVLVFIWMPFLYKLSTKDEPMW